MISKSSEYAVRSLTYLALAGDRWVLNREIAEELELPPPFLTKLLGTLTREGLLASQRGRAGGFRLMRRPESIRLLEIVDPFDRLSDRRQCLLGQSVCSETHSCPLHDSWKAIQDEFRDLFTRTTLADVLASTREDGFPRARTAGVPARAFPMPNLGVSGRIPASARRAAAKRPRKSKA